MCKHATPSLAPQIFSVPAYQSLSVTILKVISCYGTKKVCMAYETMQQLGESRCDTWTLECVVPYCMYSGLSV